MAGLGTPSSSALQRQGSTVGAREERQRLGLVLESVVQDGGERIRIKSVLAKSAASASVKACDLLVRIDGRSCSELSLSEATNLIKMAALAPGPPGQRTPKPKSKSSAAGSKMCGIGLTVLETPPHAVISIADGSPLARSHQVLQGDILIAIEDELVADATMEDIVKLVIGPEGTDVTVWLQRGEGAFSHHHSEVAAETRANLVKLKGLHRDGVLDEKAYRAAVEMCWKGCYSVTVTRSNPYKGGLDVDRGELEPSLDEENVSLTLFRPSTGTEFTVLLPRPQNAPQTPSGGVDDSADAAVCDNDGSVVARASDWDMQRALSAGCEPDEKAPESPYQSTAAGAGAARNFMPPHARLDPSMVEDAARRRARGWGETNVSNAPRVFETLMDPNAFEVVDSVLVSAFVGVGDKLGLGLRGSKDGAVCVTSISEDGSAKRSNAICIGDQLVTVDGCPVGGPKGGGATAAASLIANQSPGVHVTLVFCRYGDAGRRELAVVLPRPGATQERTVAGSCSCPVCTRPISAQSASQKIDDIGGHMLNGIMRLLRPVAASETSATSGPIGPITTRAYIPRLTRVKPETMLECFERMGPSGAVMSSDDTDSVVHGSRWRVKIDAEDEADCEWLITQEQSAEEKQHSRVARTLLIS